MAGIKLGEFGEHPDRTIPSQAKLRDTFKEVSWRVNRAKGEQSLEELLEMCRAILKV